MSVKGFDLVLNSLENRWKDYLDHVKSCRREASDEAVHDLRVTTRRVLSAMDFQRAILPGSDLQKLRSTLKVQLDELDELADVQAILFEVGEVLGDLPLAQPFHEHLKKREKHLSNVAKKQIEAIEVTNLNKRVTSIRKSHHAFTEHSQVTDVVVLAIIDNTYTTAHNRYLLLDNNDTEMIHQLRVDFRKFRYMVEIIHPALRLYPKELLVRMRDYQDRMGVIQDYEILLANLEAFSTKENIENTGSLQQYFMDKHRQAVDGFHQGVDQIHDFWRPSGRSRFPWLVNPPGSGKPDPTKPPQTGKSS